MIPEESTTEAADNVDIMLNFVSAVNVRQVNKTDISGFGETSTDRDCERLYL